MISDENIKDENNPYSEATSAEIKRLDDLLEKEKTHF
jgi:hypothetical protein